MYCIEFRLRSTKYLFFSHEGYNNAQFNSYRTTLAASSPSVDVVCSVVVAVSRRYFWLRLPYREWKPLRERVKEYSLKHVRICFGPCTASLVCYLLADYLDASYYWSTLQQLHRLCSRPLSQHILWWPQNAKYEATTQEPCEFFTFICLKYVHKISAYLMNTFRLRTHMKSGI